MDSQEIIRWKISVLNMKSENHRFNKFNLKLLKLYLFFVPLLEAQIMKI